MAYCDFRFWTHTWPFTFGVRLGWASAWAANPDPRTARGRVFLFRGQAVVFSHGFGSLCRRLRQQGVWTEDLRCVGDRWVGRHLVREQRAGRLHGPVVFVGHSCGGRYSLFLARQLADAGIAIDLLVCVDVAIPLPVPANVKHSVNLYLTRRRIYPARPLVAEAGSATVIENFDLHAPQSPVPGHWRCHLNLTSSAVLQDYVYGRIMQVFGGPGCAA
jgi:hypothetical protein